MNTAKYMTIIEELIKWSECDAIIHMGIIGRLIMIRATLESTIVVNKSFDSKKMEAALQYLGNFEKQTIEQTVKLMEKYDKPIVGVYLLNDDKTRTITDVDGCKYKGVNFITPERAVKALGKMYKYAQWLK
jgi:hypothetical protein